MGVGLASLPTAGLKLDCPLSPRPLPSLFPALAWQDGPAGAACRPGGRDLWPRTPTGWPGRGASLGQDGPVSCSCRCARPAARNAPASCRDPLAARQTSRLGEILLSPARRRLERPAGPVWGAGRAGPGLPFGAPGPLLRWLHPPQSSLSLPTADAASSCCCPAGKLPRLLLPPPPSGEECPGEKAAGHRLCYGRLPLSPWALNSPGGPFSGPSPLAPPRGAGGLQTKGWGRGLSAGRAPGNERC